MFRTTAAGAAALRWISVLLLLAALVAIVAIPGAQGVAAAATLALLGFGLFEVSRPRGR